MYKQTLSKIKRTGNAGIPQNIIHKNQSTVDAPS